MIDKRTRNLENTPRGIDEAEQGHPVGIFRVVAVVVAVPVAVVMAVPAAPTGLLVVMPTSHYAPSDGRSLPLGLAAVSQIPLMREQDGAREFGDGLS